MCGGTGELVTTAQLTDAIRAVVKRHAGVRLVLLFGSQSRGTMFADSDVDLAIDAVDTDLLELAAELDLELAREVDILPLPALSLREMVLATDERIRDF